MTYILVGPGLRDNVSLENLFPVRTVEPLSAVSAVKKIQQMDKQDAGELPASSAQAKQARKTYQDMAEPVHEREKAVYAAQIMTRSVITISDSQKLSKAWNVMTEHNFRHLPVLSDDDGKLVGMVSEHDFVTSAIEIGGLPPLAVPGASIRTVAELMSSPILSASADTDIHELARVMYERHIGAMPILDSEGELTGIITHRDILKALV